MNNMPGVRQLTWRDPGAGMPQRPAGPALRRALKCVPPLLKCLPAAAAAVLLSGALVKDAAYDVPTARTTAVARPAQQEEEGENIVLARKAATSAIDTLMKYCVLYPKGNAKIMEAETNLGKALLGLTPAEMVAVYRGVEGSLAKVDSTIEEKAKIGAIVPACAGLLYGETDSVVTPELKLGSVFLILRNVPRILKSTSDPKNAADSDLVELCPLLEPSFVDKSNLLIYLNAADDGVFKQLVIDWGWGRAPLSNDDLFSLFLSLRMAGNDR